MSETSLVPSGPKPLSKAQARKRLDQDQYIAWLMQSDASDARCYFELARYATRRHEKGEMIASTVIGFVSGLVLGGGGWAVSLLIGIAAFIATLVLIFLFHWLRAPSAFYKRAQSELVTTKLLLEEEKERSKKARLIGRIICYNAETQMNTWMEVFGPREYPRDFIILMNVSVTNDSELAATVAGFGLSLIWNGNVYRCREFPVPNRAFIKHRTGRPGGGIPWIEWEPVKPFPLNVEITNTTHQTGWLKFWTGPIQDLKIDETAKLVLEVFDHRNEPHTIFDGPVVESHGCGEIQYLDEDPKSGWE